MTEFRKVISQNLPEYSEDFTLEENFCFILDWWQEVWSQAVKTGDDADYIFFLKEAKKTFTRIYAVVKTEEMIVLIGQVLQLLSCEIKENNIKYKQSKMPF